MIGSGGELGGGHEGGGDGGRLGNGGGGGVAITVTNRSSAMRRDRYIKHLKRDWACAVASIIW